MKKETKTAVGYIRVSTDKQDASNQRSAINEASAREGFKVRFVEEQISSRKEDRKIYEVVESLQAGETLIIYELSRLARSIGQIFSITEKIKERKAFLWVLTPNEIRTGNGNALQADMLFFALSVASQLERDLISERTKNALRARKEMGMILGRPKGKGKKVDQTAIDAGFKPEALRDFYKTKVMTAQAIARLLKIDGRTVREWLKTEITVKD